MGGTPRGGTEVGGTPNIAGLGWVELQVGWNSKGADLIMWIFQQSDVGGIDFQDLGG